MAESAAPVDWKSTKRDGREYFVLTDPRAKFMYGYITNQGAAFSKLDQGFVFPSSMKEDFDSIIARLSAMPLLKVDNEKGAARYSHEELTNLKCAYVSVKRFKDNPNSPTDYEYYAPDEQTLQQANSLVFKNSRATPEQVEKLQAALAAGTLTYDQTGRTPRELTDAIKDNSLSQADARGLLHFVEPPSEQIVTKIKDMVTNGQLSDYVMRKLVSDGHKLTDEQARLGVEGLVSSLDETLVAAKAGTLDPNNLTFTLKNCYDIEGAARKMATLEEQRKVKAYVDSGLLRDTREIEYETLTRAQAKNFITSGAAYAHSGSKFDEIYQDLDRSGWTAAGTNSAYKSGTERNYADGTAQGGAQRSAEKIRELLNGASSAPWPDRGYVAGQVVHADRFNVLLVDDNKNHYVADRENFARFDEGTDPQDFVGEQIGFVMSKRGAFGIGFRSAESSAAATALLDAQQYKRASGLAFKEGVMPTGAATGTVSAVRSGYAAIDLDGGSTIAVPKTSLNNQEPTFGESVTFTPPGLEQTQGAATPAKARSNGRSR
jgi:hypothetical protein